MTSAPDRRKLVEFATEAMAAGARRAAACAELGLHPQTLARWHDPEGGIRPDQRPLAPRPVPANKLGDEERASIVATCALPEFASLPPSQIVPRLADCGTYIASESSFYRVLREHGQNHRRGRARSPTKRKPPASFEAKGPCQVWTWEFDPVRMAANPPVEDLRIGRAEPPGCRDRSRASFSTSTSSPTSGAGRVSAGKSTSARPRKTRPPSCSARSRPKNASPARWFCTRITEVP